MLKGPPPKFNGTRDNLLAVLRRSAAGICDLAEATPQRRHRELCIHCQFPAAGASHASALPEPGDN